MVVASQALFAVEDCNSIRPDWKLPGTNCSITPYYYTISISQDEEMSCECGESYHNFSLTGSATQYFTSLSCDNCACAYACKSPSYSCDGTKPECEYMPSSGCGDTHPRYGCILCFYCGSSHDSCSSTGSWNNKVFTGAFDYTDSGSHNGDVWTYNFSKSLTATAIFDKPTDPNCYTVPQVKIDKYDSRVLVRAKDGDRCCESGSSQTIRISCSGASHIKNVQYTQNDGKLYTVYVEKASDVDYCNENNHSHGSVKVTYHPRHGKVQYKAGLEETVEVSCDFYDKAGNACGSGKATITFTLSCPPPPGKG